VSWVPAPAAQTFLDPGPARAVFRGGDGSGCVQARDGGVMVLLEFARSRVARIGMMLAAIFDGWEDRRRAVLRRLGERRLY